MKQKIILYLKLMRIDRPVGIWLLFFPCIWGLLFGAKFALQQGYANLQWADLAYYSILFFVGAVIMRSAGCVINDIIDRKLDAQVERTKDRPLARGDISLIEAAIIYIILCAFGLLVLVHFPLATIITATISLPLIMLYPHMKKFIAIPQLFLGITFNWGVFLGFITAINIDILDLIGFGNTPKDIYYDRYMIASMILLYLGAVTYTVGYDTIYALADIQDDEKIGVKSSARFFKKNILTFISLCYIVTCIIWLAAGYLADLSPYFYLGVSFWLAHIIWQIIVTRKLLKQQHTTSKKYQQKYITIFKSNGLSAVIFIIAIIAGLF